MEDSGFIVEMKHITKRFPGIIANNDVSLSIRKGEIFALLGENGAGKSTIMSVLFGMYEPDEGEIFIKGEKVTITSPRHATQLGIGMVHQHFKLVSNYTVAENIILGSEPQNKLGGFIPRVDIKKANADIAELSQKYGLKVDPQSVISDLNVSTQQSVEILKMLYRDNEILIFDEPTVGIDPQSRNFILDKIKDSNKNGATVIYTSHYMEEVEAICSRIAIMDNGKVIAIGTSEELKKMVVEDTSTITLEEVFLTLTGKKLRDY